MKKAACYVCGLDVDRTKPHLVSIGADGIDGTRHTKGDPACLPVVEHAANVLAHQAYTLSLVIDRCSYTSPVRAALEDARKALLVSANEVLDYI